MTAPLSDEEIRAPVVGELKEHNATIELVAYDEEWPRLFAREAVRIHGALRAKVLLLEHAGSTSVPGLAAKPIIDMVLVVADTRDEDAYVPELEAAGYVLRIRELYLNTKRELSTREWKYVQNYADAKSAVVQEILGRALSA